MDVAYIEEISELVKVVHSRNITIGIGCGCYPGRRSRFQQVQSFPIDDWNVSKSYDHTFQINTCSIYVLLSWNDNKCELFKKCTESQNDFKSSSNHSNKKSVPQDRLALIFCFGLIGAMPNFIRSIGKLVTGQNKATWVKWLKLPSIGSLCSAKTQAKN